MLCSKHTTSFKKNSPLFYLSPLPPLSDPVHMESVLDLLVFVAVTVYHVNPYQLSALMLAKLLGQDTVEALVYK